MSNWNDCCCGKIEDFRLVLNDLVLTMTGSEGFTIDLSQFDQILSTTEVGGVTTELSISNGNTVSIKHPAPAINTINVTEVLRTTLDIAPTGDINNNANPRFINGYTVGLDEIGAVVGGPNFVLPAGNYEIEALVNFEFQGGNPRTNFNLLLRQGNTVLQEAKGHNYMRNENDHNEASQSTTFFVNTTGGTFNLATQREASTGNTEITGGWVIIRRYEQKTVLIP